MKSEEECDFLDGKFFSDSSSCAEVNCLESSCGLVAFRHKDKPDHWYRFYLPLFQSMG